MLYVSESQIPKCMRCVEALHTYRAAAKSLQSCPTLCSPMDGSLPGSSIPGILQARILEWVAISFSNRALGDILTFQGRASIIVRCHMNYRGQFTFSIEVTLALVSYCWK